MDAATYLTLGDIAMVTCEENVLTAEDGSPGFVAGGQVVTTNLFVDTEQGWRLWSHHASPVLMEEDEDEGKGGEGKPGEGKGGEPAAPTA